MKQHLAAIRMLFDFLVVGQIVPMNPAASVRGPKHVVKKGITPVLTAEEARQLLDSIETDTVVGLRDRALIGVMVFSFARVGAVVAMNVEDYFQQGKRFWFRLHEKGGKRHDVPAHHKAEEDVDAYLIAAGTGEGKNTPLFRTLDRHRRLTQNRLNRRAALAMVKRRARGADLSANISCHTIRATGITAYLYEWRHARNEPDILPPSSVLSRLAVREIGRGSERKPAHDSCGFDGLFKTNRNQFAVAAMTEFNFVALPGQPNVKKRREALALFSDAGEDAWRRLIEFFTANVRNINTRQAYVRAVVRFAAWCSKHKIGLHQLTPFLIAAYVEELGGLFARPTVKQHLAAIRVLCDFLVVGQIVPTNPAASVRGPKHVVKKGKTPVLSAEEVKQLLDSIETDTIAGLRDRALIGVMVFSFARVGAVVAMNVEDYFQQGKRFWFRLHEKGGKQHDIPVHHKADDFMDAYLIAADTRDGKLTPLFRTLDRRHRVTQNRIGRREVLAMIKRRAQRAGLPSSTCCHTFRAAGIAIYLLNQGTLERAQLIAGHESSRTTKLYDRTSDQINLHEIEKIII